MRRRIPGLIAGSALLLAAIPAWALSPFILFFDSGSSSIAQRYGALLDNAVEAFRNLDIRSIEITGHADRVGSDGVNLALSRRRAETVRDALLARGMSRQVRVSIIAAGETQPLVETADDVADAENRFVTIVMSSGCVDWARGNGRITTGECATPLPD